MEDKTMKKIFTRLFAVSAIFAAFSCAELDAPTVSPEEGQTPEADPNGEYTTLTITPVATKSYLNGSELQWSGNDFIYVFDDAGRRFKFTGEATAAASFVFTYAQWPIGAEPVYAVFCPDGNPTWVSEGKFQMTHPDSQPIHNGKSFGKKANTSVAKIEKTQKGAYTAEFKNVCGLVKFNIATTYVKNILIESTDGTPIAGNIEVDYNNGEPTYEVIEEQGLTRVSLTPKSKTDATTGDISYQSDSYYACLLPCDLNGIKVTITNINGRSESFIGSALMKIQRNKTVSLGTLDKRTITIKLSGENHYGLIESSTTGSNTYVVKDDLGIARNFEIGTHWRYYYDAEADFCLKFTKNNNDANQKYSHIGLPVYNSMYISKVTVALLNTQNKYMNLYADTSSDGKTKPVQPIASRGNPVKGTPKTWSFQQGEPEEDVTIGYTLPAKQYYLYTEGVPVWMDEVIITYTFTSLGPDASETPETPAE